jgi:hypothetical protein
MIWLRNMLMRLAHLIAKPVREIHLHELPPLGATVYFDGFFGEVLVSGRSRQDGRQILPHRLVVAFDGDPKPFRLFAGGIPVDFKKSTKLPSWKRSGK